MIGARLEGPFHKEMALVLARLAALGGETELIPPREFGSW